MTGSASVAARTLTSMEVARYPDAVTARGLTLKKVEKQKWTDGAANKVVEPDSYNEAVQDPTYGRQWREAIDAELWNLNSYGVWTVEPLPAGRRKIGCKWVFKVKYDEKGRASKFKARLVAQGFSQQYG